MLKPYEGPSIRGADPSTLKAKVMTGYQGWFNCPGDGANLGWGHWAQVTADILDLEILLSICGRMYRNMMTTNSMSHLFSIQTVHLQNFQPPQSQNCHPSL